MVKAVAYIALLMVFPLPAGALAQTGQHAEVGVPDGRLAAAALTRGDFERAARRLNAVRPGAANDPARLINLGHAYAGMGRMALARDAYLAARYAADSTLLLADGSEASSREIARRSLARIQPAYAMH